ncbi:tetratricopeptide repeat protein [Fodinicola feengrottensis]|uniref:Tetratricopeptide repeat protein n=2 Tax=Fodinicola feengrottensis TaxID=435914 RepID=A0ABN2FU23_9ACTN
MSAAFSRAVDLSSLAGPAAAPAGPAGNGARHAAPDTGRHRAAAPDAAADPNAPLTVIDATETSFQADVIDRSMTTPVVIDFWADWCQPCKTLSPTLENLAAEGGGSWVLVKVDVDANPRLSQALQIQSIPTVMAVIKGQLMEGFQGAIGEAEARQFIAAVLQAGGVEPGAGPAGEAGPPIDPRLEAADDQMAAGDLTAAKALYEQVLVDLPNDPVAKSGIAQADLLLRIDGVDLAAAVSDADAAPDDVAAQTLAADSELVQGEAPAAFARLIRAVRRTAGDDRDAARKHLLKLFEVASPDDPAVAKARRDLASALF